jgi:hypothetical protein
MLKYADVCCIHIYIYMYALQVIVGGEAFVEIKVSEFAMEELGAFFQKLTP